MSRIRGKNTAPERIVFHYLKSERIYFQKHYSRTEGNPDVALPRKKKAVFIDGDFWHGRTFKKRRDGLPDYWVKKISRNMARDKRNRHILKRNGWEIMRVWESEIIKKDNFKVLEKIKSFLLKN